MQSISNRITCKNCSVKTWTDLKQLIFSKSWKFCSETALRTSSAMMSWPELSFGCSSGTSALLAPDTYPCVKGEQKNHGCNAMQAKNCKSSLPNNLTSTLINSYCLDGPNWQFFSDRLHSRHLLAQMLPFFTLGAVDNINPF